MSEVSWVLRGVDPETRQNAVAEAERRGVSLADYLTEAVLHKALSEQVSALAAETPVEEPSLRPDSEGFGIRQRLATLERRLGTTVGSLDGAISALDSSLFDLTARLGEAEAFSGATAEALQQGLHDVSGQLAAVRLHISDVELNDSVRDEELAERLDAVNAIARSADRATVQLFDAHSALKNAVADDFTAFTNDTADRIDAGLADVRAAADTAAEQAEAAVAHLILELRSVREALDQSVAESAEETRARMRAAFVETAQRMAGLSERVDDNERQIARTAEALQSRIVDVEDAAQTALEETAEALRQTDSALIGELGRVAQDARGALIASRGELSAEIAELRHQSAADVSHLRAQVSTEVSQLRALTSADVAGMRDGHDATLARLKLVDVAIGNTFGELATLRETIETRASEIDARARTQHAQTRAEWTDRFEAMAGRIAANEAGAVELRHAVAADVERVEACTFAALEKLGGDIAATEGHLQAQIAETARATQARLADTAATSQAAIELAVAVSTQATADLAHRIDSEATAVREHQSGAAARLTLLETGQAALEHTHADFDALLQRLQAQIADRSQHDALTARLGQTERTLDRVEHALTQNVQDVRANVDAHSAQLGETAQHIQDVARLIGRISSQTSDATAQVEARVHGLEVTVADLRLEAKLAPPAPEPVDIEGVQTEIAELNARMGGLEQAQTETFHSEMLGLNTRMAGLEQRQAEAFETLRASISHFISENDRRLQTLEAGIAPQAEIDVAGQFDELRHRIEERVLGVELRSVRTMEQVCDALALVEQRVLNGDQESEAKSA